jgi:hypothetical protein
MLSVSLKQTDWTSQQEPKRWPPASLWPPHAPRLACPRPARFCPSPVVAFDTQPSHDRDPRGVANLLHWKTARSARILRTFGLPKSSTTNVTALNVSTNHSHLIFTLLSETQKTPLQKLGGVSGSIAEATRHEGKTARIGPPT